jgi:hypothetical protein
LEDIEKTGNLIEAALWSLVAIALLIRSSKEPVELRRIFFVLSAAFFVFGITDVVESWTGAWWRPVWLLLLKASCVVVFLLGFGQYYRIRKRNKSV